MTTQSKLTPEQLIRLRAKVAREEAERFIRKEIERLQSEIERKVRARIGEIVTSQTLVARPDPRAGTVSEESVCRLNFPVAGKRRV